MFFIAPIIALALENNDFRHEIYTARHAQVVLMSIKPQEEIGNEVHEVDQILVFVAGTGKAILDGQEKDIIPGDLVYVPAGTWHNFINTGSDTWKLYTMYAPAEHRPGTVHATKEEADAAEQQERA